MQTDEVPSTQNHVAQVHLDDSPFGPTSATWRVRRSDLHGVLDAFTFVEVSVEDCPFEMIGCMIRCYVSDERAGIMLAISLPGDGDPTTYGFTAREPFADLSVEDTFEIITLASLQEVNHHLDAKRT